MLKKAPFDNTEVEIRQVFEEDDFGEEFTPELREQERRLREQTEESARSPKVIPRRNESQHRTLDQNIAY